VDVEATVASVPASIVGTQLPVSVSSENCSPGWVPPVALRPPITSSPSPASGASTPSVTA